VIFPPCSWVKELRFGKKVLPDDLFDDIIDLLVLDHELSFQAVEEILKLKESRN